MEKNHYGRVRVKTVDALRVACLRAASLTPEDDSLKHMEEWLFRQDIKDPAEIRKFVFDVEVSPEQQRKGLRGYEVWYAVPNNVKASGGVKIREFRGGLYAVMRVTDPFSNPFEVIPAGWNRLVGWAKTNAEYVIGKRQCLEEQIGTGKDVCLDLRLPIAPSRKKTNKQGK